MLYEVITLALHVAVLILDDAGHERLGGIEQVPNVLPGVAKELAKEVILGQPNVLEGVRREEAVLGDQERGIGRLGRAAGDRGEIRRFRITSYNVCYTKLLRSGFCVPFATVQESGTEWPRYRFIVCVLL